MAINKNNTIGLQRSIAKKLGNSAMWIVLRLDKEGIHMHMPNEEHLVLLGEFFAANPEMFEEIKQFVAELDKADKRLGDIRKLKRLGGNGYDYSHENGKFEVRSIVIKQFTKLSEAKEHYESLKEEKTIWDITGIPELLECHTF